MALNFSDSILTLCAEVWLPNKTNPDLFIWVQICAGPVSFEIIKLASFIKLISSSIFNYFPLFKITFAFNNLDSSISFGPGATAISYLFSYLALI